MYVSCFYVAVLCSVILLRYVEAASITTGWWPVAKVGWLTDSYIAMHSGAALCAFNTAMSIPRFFDWLAGIQRPPSALACSILCIQCCFSNKNLNFVGLRLRVDIQQQQLIYIYTCIYLQSSHKPSGNSNITKPNRKKKIKFWKSGLAAFQCIWLHLCWVDQAAGHLTLPDMFMNVCNNYFFVLEI